MRVKISIDCETINELQQHLFDMQNKIRREARRMKLNPLEDEFPVAKTGPKLDDNNCYGSREVTIWH